MKKTILIGAFFICYNSFAQKSYHSFFMGTNLSGVDLDLSTSEIKGLTNKDFENARVGFNIGYKFIRTLPFKAAISMGVEFKNINCKFHRPYYNDPNTINPNLSSIYEDIKFFRISAPIQAYYNFINKTKLSFYFTAGSDIIFMNKIKRTADYKIPGPPLGYVDGTFKGDQKIKFDRDMQIGFALLSGVGSEFSIDEKLFVIELLYYGDISKNKLLTLHNIEYDSHFYGKLKSFQLKIVYKFSLDFKKSRDRDITPNQ